MPTKKRKATTKRVEQDYQAATSEANDLEDVVIAGLFSVIIHGIVQWWRRLFNYKRPVDH